ncbi:conserved hypothetical protein [Uncinocarpus reesii 1704]|uniref:Class II aldolase/adducin N-terminal domain-containing protein n=1 Tax=Uncinocarpus reesii (strain UAMH 1704) TaxID=336963 RepID=C4JI70_UNCRE|nr:uncharacterized protein UREG_02816 [Uncinocarpus reesii 1704]EEP77967.1 conserved hypothetical protein [Uncinocarpus reesii 1704]
MAPSVVEALAPAVVPQKETHADDDRGAERSEVIEQVQMNNRTVSGQELHIRSYPKFDTLEEERLYRKQHLAAAFRVFADRGFDEGVAGHISVRDPILTDHFSFAIHSEIHKARPNINAACHAHSVHGKAFSVFGRELDMMTQDALRFYKSHGVYNNFGGVVLDREEGVRITKALGDGKAVILRNHGLLTVGESVDEAAFWFISLDKTCHAQLLADAAANGSGYKKIMIDEEEAEVTAKQVGGPDKGWLAFQGYYDEQVAKTNGAFLK